MTQNEENLGGEVTPRNLVSQWKDDLPGSDLQKLKDRDQAAGISRDNYESLTGDQITDLLKGGYSETSRTKVSLPGRSSEVAEQKEPVPIQSEAAEFQDPAWQSFMFQNPASGRFETPEEMAQKGPEPERLTAEAIRKATNEPTAGPFVEGPADPKDTITGSIISARYGEEIHERLHEFRVAIDSLYLTALEYPKTQPEASSRELSLAITALQFARQFCGKILQERGAPKPYNAAQVNQVDKGFIIQDIISIKNPVQGTQLMRDRIQDVITDFSVFVESASSLSWIEMVAQTSVMQHLLEARMMLGELFAILLKKWIDAPQD